VPQQHVDDPSVTVMKMSIGDLQKALLEPSPETLARARRRNLIGATLVVTLILAVVAFVGWFKFARP
jgi:hypothetical protein